MYTLNSIYHKKTLSLLNYTYRNIRILLILLFGIMCTFHTSKAFAQVDSLFSVRGVGGGGGFFIPIFSPYNENLYFVTCDMGGVYRSEDAGKSWEMLNFTFSPKKPHLKPEPIFLTKDRIVWIDDRRGLAISEDEGKTIKHLVIGPWNDEKKIDEDDKRSKNITSFLPLDTSGKNYLVGTDFGLWSGNIANFKKISDKPISFLTSVGSEILYIEDDNTLAKSSDNGKTFIKTPLNHIITALTAIPSEENTVVLFIATKENKILKSTDYGVTWQLLNEDAQNVLQITIPKGQDSTIYAYEYYYNKQDTPPELLRSTDGGETWENIFIMDAKQETFWQPLNVELSWLQTKLYWSYYLTGFAVSDHNPNLLMATTQGELFISRNAGETWETFYAQTVPPAENEEEYRTKSIGLEVTSTWGYYFDPHVKNNEYIAYTDIGFARSVDSGESWLWSAKGARWTNTFYDLAFDPDIPGKIYAAVSNLHDLPHYMYISHISPSSNTHKGGIAVSTDFGKTWKVPYDRKAKNSLPAQVTTSVVIDKTSPKDNRILYASLFGEDNEDDFAGVYVSKDNGTTWALTEGQPGGYNKHIYKLEIHPQTGDLYALITGLRAAKPNFFNKEEGGVWRSQDKGKTWQHISKGSTLNHWANAIAFHPTDPNGIYVAAASPPGIGSGGIYYTSDSGKRWWHILKDADISRLKGLGYTFDHMMSVLVHPTKTNIIFAGGTNHGLFFTVDGGRKWRWCQEFPFASAQSITYNPHNLDEILVTTLGSGVWSASISELIEKYGYSYDKIK